jgi:hypothetical protein
MNCICALLKKINVCINESNVGAAMACLAWHSALATLGSLVRPNRLDLEIKKQAELVFKFL